MQDKYHIKFTILEKQLSDGDYTDDRMDLLLAVEPEGFAPFAMTFTNFDIPEWDTSINSISPQRAVAKRPNDNAIDGDSIVDLFAVQCIEFKFSCAVGDSFVYTMDRTQADNWEDWLTDIEPFLALRTIHPEPGVESRFQDSLLKLR